MDVCDCVSESVCKGRRTNRKDGRRSCLRLWRPDGNIRKRDLLPTASFPRKKESMTNRHPDVNLLLYISFSNMSSSLSVSHVVVVDIVCLSFSFLGFFFSLLRVFLLSKILGGRDGLTCPAFESRRTGKDESSAAAKEINQQTGKTGKKEIKESKE